MRLAPLAFLLAFAAQTVSAAPAVRPIQWIENDYAKALADAQSRKVPIFIDAWAPW